MDQQKCPCGPAQCYERIMHNLDIELSPRKLYSQNYILDVPAEQSDLNFLLFLADNNIFFFLLTETTTLSQKTKWEVELNGSLKHHCSRRQKPELTKRSTAGIFCLPSTSRAAECIWWGQKTVCSWIRLSLAKFVRENKQTSKQTWGARRRGRDAVQPSASSHLQLTACSLKNIHWHGNIHASGSLSLDVSLALISAKHTATH